MRDAEDSRRYKALYNIDNNNYEFADLIIDTQDKTPEQIVQLILDKLENKQFVTRL
jgi:cytidylate kinase